jgi:hypothetical protein
VAKRLFTFVQLELPWELGPPDGRYLLRKALGPDSGTAEHVVVLATVGAARRGLLGRRSKTRSTDAVPAPVPVARATVIDAVALSAEGQARAWMAQLDPERDASAAAAVLNRLLFAHRLASASAHVHEISPSQALVVRAGFGEGEQVAEGLWSEARELVPGEGRARRRAAALRPQERLAALLAGKGQALLCEELVLRARGDVEQGRLSHAAIELDRAYEAALSELPSLRRNDLEQRISELRDLAPALREAAATALSAARPGGSDGAVPDEATVRHALERLEAALRARSAAGLL